MNNSIEAVGIALVSGLVVAIWTQWRQDVRHNNIRDDERLKREQENAAKTIQRLLDAVVSFVSNVRDLEASRREGWLELIYSGVSQSEREFRDQIADINFINEVLTEIDFLELEVLDEELRTQIPKLRTALDVERKNIVEASGTVGPPPIPIMLSTAFRKEKLRFLNVARKRLLNAQKSNPSRP